MIVNYYLSRGTIFVNGTSRATERGDASAAISVALKGPARVRLEDRRRNYRAARRWLYSQSKDCRWCGCPLAYSASTIDHVVPLSRGGTNRWENLVLACQACNAKRANNCGVPQGVPLRKITQAKANPQ